MSQHADITKVVVSKAIKSNWNPVETCQLYLDVLNAIEYDDDEWANPKHIIGMADYMLTQKDGLYGVSHQQIIDWLNANMAGLVCEKVRFINGKRP